MLDSRAFYEPFGDYRLEPTGDYTDQGYTGHLGNNSGSNDIGLIYMNARFYVPGIGRFASADTIVPDPANPQSFNRYSYVQNRPLNMIDPTGHIGCDELGTEQCSQDNSEEFVNIPNWWINSERVSIENYGVFDSGHIERGFNRGTYIIGEINRALGNGGGSFILESGKFEAEYWVSGDLSEEQINEVALGIYMDFELGYEAYQASGFFSRYGAFAPEDLPSDHIGFWAAANGYSREEIPMLLENLGSVQPFDSPFDSLMFNSIPSGGRFNAISIPRNHEFQPMAPQIVDYGYSGAAIIWQNVDWPQAYQMSPIGSDEHTWLRVDQD